jgi:hypothetical protein
MCSLLGLVCSILSIWELIHFCQSALGRTGVPDVIEPLVRVGELYVVRWDAKMVAVPVSPSMKLATQPVEPFVGVLPLVVRE